MWGGVDHDHLMKNRSTSLDDTRMFVFSVLRWSDTIY
jgi:hypothetical protein